MQILRIDLVEFGRKTEKFNQKRENRRVNDSEFEKKSMNPHGCVEKWKCDFPLIVPLRLKNVEVNISQQYFVLLFSIFFTPLVPPSSFLMACSLFAAKRNMPHNLLPNFFPLSSPSWPVPFLVQKGTCQNLLNC